MRIPFILIAVTAASTAGEGLDLFEKRVRPVLAAKCYACHSARTTATSGLVLDTRAGLGKGGHRGPAIVPGDPNASLLIKALRRTDAALKMPPGAPLGEPEIAAIEEWIRLGAPGPPEAAATTDTTFASKLAQARTYWAFQPIRSKPEPRLMRPASGNWIDSFLLARLRARNLRPAPPAGKRTLLRRLTFDLTGLPPSPEEVDAFLKDTSPRAYEVVVDRLLASPHYGERWARHWLDLARYAETDGHEFDREKPNAWRYRDYLIRAFNRDLPYDRLIREHIAGDLMDRSRLESESGVWESPIATAFFGLGEERNAADDLTEVRAEKLDNQIDTLGKTFLGLTIACARCHDHKFDPISTRDYYALAGVLSSKQVIQTAVDGPEAMRRTYAAAEELAALDRQVRDLQRPQLAVVAQEASVHLAEAARKLAAGDDPKLLAAGPLRAWLEELAVAAREPEHVLYPLARIAKSKAAFAVELEAIRGEWDGFTGPRAGDQIVADFSSAKPVDWRADGPAFGGRPETGSLPVATSLRGGAREFTGFLTSKTFRALDARYLHVRLAGMNDTTSRRQPGNTRVSLIGDGRDVAVTPDESGRFTWRTSGMDKARGELLYAELSDRARNGYLMVDKIVVSPHRDPPRAANPLARNVLGLDLKTLDDLALGYQAMFESAARQTANSAAELWVLDILRRVPASVAPPAELAEARSRHASAAQALPETSYALAAAEDKPHNARLYLAGNHRTPGEEVPRRFLEVLSRDTAPYTRGSGRWQLADAIATGDNPLAARVLVNRVWKHHFGEGLVRTVDNFGRMGEAPSHPELLDTLAARFVEEGWSIKKLHRAIVTSSAYRMSSQPLAANMKADPENRLLHHMRVRRLEGEAIRDAILAVTGTLDRTLYGPPVAPHISAYQDGRGKPAQSGPVDGNGRRSIYLGVRRNFLPPLFTAFDYPPTVTTVGRRSTSTVPSQALILLNNEFVARQAERWADRSAAAETHARIDRMFLAAFGRPVETGEVAVIEEFLARQQALHAGAGDAAFKAWTDVAHSLLNSKEFLFIR